MSEEAFQEAEKLQRLYYAALIKLGAGAIARSLRSWQNVPIGTTTRTDSTWLNAAVQHIMADRTEVRALGLAYYRLVRALYTGRTIAKPGTSTEADTTLDRLRDDFASLVHSPMPKSSGDGKVKVDRIPELDKIIRDSDKTARQQAKENLRNVSTRGMEKEQKAIDKDADKLTAKDAKDRQRKAHKKAGALQASEHERITLNASRGLVFDIAQADRLAIGYARFSTTGTPCAWCAMLISRGAVYKRFSSSSKQSTAASTADTKNVNGSTGKDIGDSSLFHDNDHCITIPMFSNEQFQKSELFARNRQLDAEWQALGKELSRKAGKKVYPTLQDWRAYWYRRNKTTRAQAAA